MQQYERRLSDKNELDYPALIDKAIAYIKDLAAKENIAGNLPYFLPKLSDKTEVSCLFFSELGAKEKEFINALEMVFESAYGKKFNDISNDGSSTAGENYHFYESYGAANEVRYVAEKIEKNKKSFGDVIIIYASDVYENLLRAEFEDRGIKYSFPNGTHAASENYIALMLDMIAFVKEDYSYEVLDKVIKNPIFNLK